MKGCNVRGERLGPNPRTKEPLTPHQPQEIGHCTTKKHDLNASAWLYEQRRFELSVNERSLSAGGPLSPTQLCSGLLPPLCTVHSPSSKLLCAACWPIRSWACQFYARSGPSLVARSQGKTSSSSVGLLLAPWPLDRTGTIAVARVACCTLLAPTSAILSRWTLSTRTPA